MLQLSSFRQFFTIFLLCTAGAIFSYQCWSLPSAAIETRSIVHLPPPTQKLILGANKQVGKTLYYDPSYTSLKYPDGDVPIVRGVCTDVVIRALRDVKIDLQKEIHQDMKENFDHYPKNWGLKKPDKNIDHRRVPNQQIYFKRQGWSQPISKNPNNYWPGDIVAWKLSNGRDHIGVVSDRVINGKRPMVVHNIGRGTRIEDVLFDWKITGHYRLQTKDKEQVGSDPQKK